jgi:ligand-binding sensor domain-containing protein
MRSFLFFVVVVLILHCNNLPAQSLRESEFTHYTRVEGLSNNFISGIVQDSTGYIWVATNRGLNRFDGRFFSNYYTGSAVNWLCTPTMNALGYAWITTNSI